MLNLCQSCFAEVDVTLRQNFYVCPYCGHDFSILPLSTSAENPKDLDFAPLEIAGLSIQVFDFHLIPNGTLLQGRYSILQFKQMLQDGFCYIALDQILGQHCLVIFWKTCTDLWQFHKAICHNSPIFDTGQEPFFSACRPQEGLVLEKALQHLGWSHGRVWEVFRQVCDLVGKIHAQGEVLRFLHPSNLWITPAGNLECSINPTAIPVDWLVNNQAEEAQNVLRMLSWLFKPNASLDWKVFPLKLRAMFVEFWENPIDLHHFWNAVDRMISFKGVIRLPEESRQILRQYHCPNWIYLEDQILEIPSSEQLCNWNAVGGSWRLKEGQVLLIASLPSLYENGFISEDPDIDILHFMEQLWSKAEISMEQLDIQKLCVWFSYSDSELILEHLIEAMTSVIHFEDSLMLCKTFLAGHHKSMALEVLERAENQAIFVQEWLEIASIYRWEMDDLKLTKSAWQQAAHRAKNLWDFTYLSEAWGAFFGDMSQSFEWLHSLKNDMQNDKDMTPETRLQWFQYIDEHFGHEIGAQLR